MTGLRLVNLTIRAVSIHKPFCPKLDKSVGSPTKRPAGLDCRLARVMRFRTMQ